MCIIAALILLTGIASLTVYTAKLANAQGNMTSHGGANMTKSNMTGAAMGAGKNMTSNISAAGKGMNKTK